MTMQKSLSEAILERSSGNGKGLRALEREKFEESLDFKQVFLIPLENG
jgi:hypothetical protein